MPLTKADIFNMAAGVVGVSAQIDDVELDQSPVAKWCRQYYDHIREIILEACEWSVVSEDINLIDLGTDSDHWLYRYKYPVHAKRLNYLVNPSSRRVGGSVRPIPYVIRNQTDGAGKVIYTNLEDADGNFNVNVEDVTLFTSTMNQALMIGLGAHIGGPIRAKPQLVAGAEERWQMWLAEAKASDLRETGEDDITDSELISSRG